MAEICALADEFDVTVFLEIEPFGESGLSVDQLSDWYWRFGFRGEAAEMIREPNASR